MDRDGIQADKPEPHPERADAVQTSSPVPPWERPGCFRLDCEPHRGEMLAGMAICGLIVSLVSLCLPILIFLALPLDLVTWRLARLDLARMRTGLMDPQGEEVTAEARLTARFALVLGLLWSAVWGLILFVLG